MTVKDGLSEGNVKARLLVMRRSVQGSSICGLLRRRPYSFNLLSRMRTSFYMTKNKIKDAVDVSFQIETFMLLRDISGNNKNKDYAISQTEVWIALQALEQLCKIAYWAPLSVLVTDTCNELSPFFL